MRSEYSIVSIGTEKYGSGGYISISEIVHNKRYIVPLNHDIDIISDVKEALVVPSELSIELIALSRFQLIPSLARNIQWKEISNALVIGGGALGFATYLELKRNNIKKVELVSRRDALRKKYEANFEICDWLNVNWQEYDTFFECTGESENIKQIFENISYSSSIYLLGTPREGPYVNVLDIHRKNLKVIGAHELNGVPQKKRQEFLSEITAFYKGLAIQGKYELVRQHNYSEKKLKEILETEI